MKKERLVLIACVIMLFLSSIVNAMAVSAYLYNSNEVSYNNNASGITSTNVQGAIDELYGHVTDYTSMDTRVSKLESFFQTSNNSDWAALKVSNTELNENGALANAGGFVDFHYGGSSSDYTSRIIEESSGVLNLKASNGVKINGNEVLVPKMETIVPKTNYTSSTSYQKITSASCIEDSILLLQTPFVNTSVQGVKLTMSNNSDVILQLTENIKSYTGLFYCYNTSSIDIYVKNAANNYSNWIVVKRLSFN